MNICIQDYSMPKTNERNYINPPISFRITGVAAARWWRLFDKAVERNHLAKTADVVRELIGLTAPKLLTQVEIDYFRRSESDEANGVVDDFIEIDDKGELSLEQVNKKQTG